MRRKTIYLMVVLLVSSVDGVSQSATKRAPTGTLPRVVATVRLFHQTGPISPTKIFTPEKWGVYRLSAVGVVTAAAGDGYWSGGFQWTDGGGNESTACLTMFTLFTGSYSCNSFAFRDLSGKPLTYSVNQNGDTSGSKYNLFIVVEQLMQP
jgi:hypothetical protein